MAEYIERKAALAEMEELFHKTDPNGEEQTGFLKCHRIVRTLPAADVAPVVRGEWEFISLDGSLWCSCCKRPSGHGRKAENKYCRNCGAKMDGGNHET